MSTERDIKEAIRAIANGGGGKTFFTAEVVSVSGDTCTVKSDDFEMSDVAICAIGGASGNSLVVVPKIGSTVLIADLSDGTRRDLCIVKYTEVESITINGGNLGGLIEIEKLKDNLKSLKSYIDDLQTLSATAMAPMAGLDGGTSVMTFNGAWETKKAAFSWKNMEDTKIKH